MNTSYHDIDLEKLSLTIAFAFASAFDSEPILRPASESVFSLSLNLSFLLLLNLSFFLLSKFFFLFCF